VRTTDIGKEKEVHRIEPARIPVPQREDVPQRSRPQRSPRRFDPIEPTRPVEDPSKQPVKVPSK
jgi:hypothetical protein